MGFVHVPSKTIAAILGAILFIVTSPSAVSARIVGPSDIHVQVMEGSTEEEMQGCVAECSDIMHACCVKCQDSEMGWWLHDKYDEWDNCNNRCFDDLQSCMDNCGRAPFEPSKHPLE